MYKNNRKKPFKKNFGHKRNFKPQKRTFTPQERAKLSKLDKIVKSISTKMTKTEQAMKNKEPSFKEENLNKEIIVLLKDGQHIEGTLVNIDKYRLQLQVEDRVKYYYKHSLLGYHAKN